MKLEDFIAANGARSLDEMDERALTDLRSFLHHRVGRTDEDATETRRPRLRGKAVEMARMVEEIDAHIASRGFGVPRP